MKWIDILTAGIIALIVIAAIVIIVRNKKKGGCSCGGDCSRCACCPGPKPDGKRK